MPPRSSRSPVADPRESRTSWPSRSIPEIGERVACSSSRNSFHRSPFAPAACRSGARGGSARSFREAMRLLGFESVLSRPAARERRVGFRVGEGEPKAEEANAVAEEEGQRTARRSRSRKKPGYDLATQP